MNGLNAVAPRSSRPRAVPVALMAGALAVAISSLVLAQTPPAPPTPKAPPAQPKAQPKAPPTQTGPSAAVNGPAAGEMPPLVYTPWTRLCRKPQEADAKQVCATSREGFLDTGFLVIGAVLIEPEAVPTKLLQVTLPLGMALQPGTRVTIDQGQPLSAPFVVCTQAGCIAEIEASGELIGKMKKGQGLVVQGYHMQRGPVALTLPLADFAKANEGAPTDPKIYEDRMKKYEEEFVKKQQQLQQQGH